MEDNSFSLSSTLYALRVALVYEMAIWIHGKPPRIVSSLLHRKALCVFRKQCITHFHAGGKIRPASQETHEISSRRSQFQKFLEWM